MTDTATVALVGTCDTKLEELLFLRSQIKLHDAKVQVLLIDVGRRHVDHADINITRSTLVEQHGGTSGKSTDDLPRGELIKFMSRCATAAVKKLYKKGIIHGIVSAGGSGATSLVAPVMREALPLGFPKLIVSTVASGDTGPIVEETDISMMYSIVDIAGLNSLLREILSNAGASIGAAACAYLRRHVGTESTSELESSRASPPHLGRTKKRVGITMFGVTTPGVDAARRHLESNYPIETYIFHATGHGGKAMERLVREGRLDAVLDFTTTEICDFVAGGVMSAGETRLDASVSRGIPLVLSLGATDMVNFGESGSVPQRYQDRLLFEHNPVVTLMRTDKDECVKIGSFIGHKLKKAADPSKVKVWIPRGGVSMISMPGCPFHDEKADGTLFQTVQDELAGTGIEIVVDHRDINDTGFAIDIADALVRLMGLG